MTLKELVTYPFWFIQVEPEKVPSASTRRDQPRRALNQDNTFITQPQDDGTKLSHQINLLFIS